MQLRCGGSIFNNHVVTRFLQDCASKRIVKICWHLTKVWTKVWWHIIYGSQCMKCVLLISSSGCAFLTCCSRQKQKQDFSSKQRRLIQCFLAKRKRSNGTNMVNLSSKHRPVAFAVGYNCDIVCWLCIISSCCKSNLMILWSSVLFFKSYSRLGWPPKVNFWNCCPILLEILFVAQSTAYKHWKVTVSNWRAATDA